MNLNLADSNNEYNTRLNENPVFENEEIFASSLPVYSNDQELLLQFNEQTSEELGQHILDSILDGGFFETAWSVSLQATYFGLDILNTIDALNAVNTTLIQAYIMSTFDPNSALFKDDYSALINNTNEFTTVGYSPIEATAYAILSLDILDALDCLSGSEQSAIFENFGKAFNLQDGGFCHSLLEDDPVGPRSSSLSLSYYVYFALELLGGPNPLSTQKEDALRNFILSLQEEELCENHGAFCESSYNENYAIEWTFYAVQLLSKIGGVSSINVTNLERFIEQQAMFCPYGVFNEYKLRSMHGLPYSEYFSCAMVLYLDSQVAFDYSLNMNDIQDYILNGFSSDSGGWPNYYTSTTYLLRNTYFVVKGFYESGRALSTSIKSAISEEINVYFRAFYSDGSKYAGFHYLPSTIGSLHSIYEKLIYLKSVDVLSELTPIQKTAIYDWVLQCKYYNVARELWTFGELPGFQYDTLEFLLSHGNPVELAAFPDNITYQKTYGVGVNQIYYGISIIEMIDKIDLFHADHDLNEFTTEILAAQATETGYMEGSFFPSKIYKDHSPYRNQYLKNALSTVTTYRAVKTLQIIDKSLGTDYLHAIDVYALQEFLERQFQVIDAGISGYFWFNDVLGSESQYPVERNSYYCFKICNIYDFWTFEDYHLMTSNWVRNSTNYPAMGINYLDYKSNYAIYGVLLENLTASNCDTALNLSKIRNLYQMNMGLNPGVQEYSNLDSQVIISLSNINNCLFYALEFAAEPTTYVGFSSNYQLSMVGITDVADLTNDIYSLEASVETLDGSSQSVTDSIYTDGSVFVVSMEPLTDIAYYPNFTLECGVTYPSGLLRISSFVLPCEFIWNLQLNELDMDRQLSFGEIASYSFGIFISDSEDGTNKAQFEPNNISVDVISQSTDETLLTSSEEDVAISFDTLTSSITEVTISFNASIAAGLVDISIEIEDDCLIRDPVTINNAEAPITVSRNPDASNQYWFTLSAEILAASEPDPMDPPNKLPLNIILITSLAIIGGVSVPTAIVKMKGRKKTKNGPRSGDFTNILRSKSSNEDHSKTQGSNENTIRVLQGAKIDDLDFAGGAASSNSNRRYRFTREDCMLEDLDEGTEVNS